MDNNKYFLASGGISLAFFSFVLGSFFYVIAHNSKTKIYALEKNEHISVSIDLSKIKTTAKESRNKTIDLPPVEIPQEEPVEDKPEITKAKNINIDDMFSSVWTKDIKKQKPKEKVIDTKRKQEIAKRIKTIDTNKAKPVNQKLEDISLEKGKDLKTENSSSGNEVNEYNAKIEAIVYQNFNPPANSEGLSVRAVIELNAIGNMIDFRILNYSENQLLNEECDKIKNRLRGVLFPKSPNNKTQRITVILISKE